MCLYHVVEFLLYYLIETGGDGNRRITKASVHLRFESLRLLLFLQCIDLQGHSIPSAYLSATIPHGHGQYAQNPAATRQSVKYQKKENSTERPCLSRKSCLTRV